MGHEGYDIAEWLKERGIAGIVLKYRLPYGHHEIPSGDVRQTMRIVRKNASKWGIDPLKVGIAGSSAGGHLAATAGTRFDYGNPASENPLKKSAADLILCFCYIRLFHSGRSSDTWAQEKISLARATTGNLWSSIPTNCMLLPTLRQPFWFLADDDKVVVPRNSIEFYMALKENNIPAEMHIFAKGGHGFGMKNNKLPADQWAELFYITGLKPLM